MFRRSLLAVALVFVAGLAIAATKPLVKNVSAAQTHTWSITSADGTSFLYATKSAPGCPTVRAHFEQATAAQVTLYGCPRSDSLIGACVSLQAFAATSTAGGTIVTNAHPQFKVDVTVAETTGTSRLTAHCSNTQL